MNLAQAQNSSKAFHLAFERCMEPRPLLNGQVELPIVPAVVCAVFSIELGFKTLILRAGGQATGHRLMELFVALETATQQQIIEGVGAERQSFTSSLEEANNAFIEWRYIYEREAAHTDIEFLSKLAKATQKVIRS